MATDLFGYIGSISESTENEVLSGKLSGDDMNVFMVLRGFSFYEETVQLANAFNGSTAPPAMVYHAMHALVDPKRRRFSKWPKPKPEFDAKLVNYVIQSQQLSRESALCYLRDKTRFGGLDAVMEAAEIQQQKTKGRKK